MRRLLVAPLTAAIMLAPLNAASAATSAHASGKTKAAIARLDHRIESARTNPKGWRAWLARWNDQIDQGERAAWTASALVIPAPTGTELSGALRPGVLGGLSAVARAAEWAQARLDKVRSEPQASAALQQVFAWQDYLDQLRAARHDLKLFGSTVSAFAIPAGPVTYDVWGRMLLVRLGAPACGDNRLAVVAWETAESTDATFNPLATTHVGGVSAINTSGVQNYATLGDGLAATVDTLTSGAPGYTGIMDALQVCAPASVTIDAIRASVWCANCANGAYVADCWIGCGRTSARTPGASSPWPLPASRASNRVLRTRGGSCQTRATTSKGVRALRPGDDGGTTRARAAVTFSAVC